MTSWDGQWYWDIAENGYPGSALDDGGRPAQTSLAFFPLYPMVVRAVMQLTGIEFRRGSPHYQSGHRRGSRSGGVPPRGTMHRSATGTGCCGPPVHVRVSTRFPSGLHGEPRAPPTGVSTPSASPTAVLVVSRTRVAVGHHPECDTCLGSGDPAALGVADAGTQPAPLPATRPHAEDPSRPDQFATCGRRCRNRAVACDHRGDHRRARCIPSHSPSLAWLLRLGAAVPVGRSCCLKRLATRHRVHWHGWWRDSPLAASRATSLGPRTSGMGSCLSALPLRGGERDVQHRPLPRSRLSPCSALGARPDHSEVDLPAERLHRPPRGGWGCRAVALGDQASGLRWSGGWLGLPLTVRWSGSRDGEVRSLRDVQPTASRS